MKKPAASEASFLLSFFLGAIAVGTVLLLLPFSWKGRAGLEVLAGIDALFIASSAVCVTGLATVDTADFSVFGQTVILILIQVGGLGIISFSSLMLLMPGRRLSFRRLKTIRGFSIDGVEYNPVKIVRNIVFFTFAIELLGACALYFLFSAEGVERPVFTALFHSVSAFCNAGFSLFPTSLEGYNRNPLLLVTLAILVVTGGIGFIVLQDLERRLRGKRRRLSYHSKLVLSATAVLISAGAAAFYLLERRNAFLGMSGLEGAVNALFQSITPRTAGFNAVPMDDLRASSKLLTMILMFIGGAPGSIAGGIKVSTALIVLMVMVRRPDEYGEINVFKRRLDTATTNRAVVYFLKALLLVVLAVGVLSLVEGGRGSDFGDLVFETVSAFGTVGLSLGATPELGPWGKLVIIVTMFAGRVGLIAFAFPRVLSRVRSVVYPQGDVLLG